MCRIDGLVGVETITELISPILIEIIELIG